MNTMRILSAALLTILVLTCGVSSAEMRQYTEVTLESQLPQKTHAHGDQILPDGHPPLEGLMDELPPGHPPIEGMEGMQGLLPDGHPPIEGMEAMLPDGHPPIDPAMNQAPNDLSVPSSGSSKYAWTLPEGWKEEPGSGMRLATFRIKDDPKAVDCSMIELGPLGNSNNLESNLVRWMQQINIDPPAGKAMADFIAGKETVQSQGGAVVQIFDFSTLQSSEGDDAMSMIAGIMELDNATLFVKMTGTKKNIAQNKSGFKTLNQSLRTVNHD